MVVDVPQTFHLYTAMKQTLIAFDALVRGLGDAVHAGAARATAARAPGSTVRRTYGEWMVPGLGYRVRARGAEARDAACALPLEPRGPGCWWARLGGAARGWLRRRRWALYTCHVIGTVAEKP